MYRADSLVTKPKRQRVFSYSNTATTTSSDSVASQQGEGEDAETEEVKSFLREFTQDFPATSGLSTPPLRTEGFEDPKLREELKKEFVYRGEWLAAKAVVFLEQLKQPGTSAAVPLYTPLQTSANLGFPNVRFLFPVNNARRPVQNVLFEPGYFALGPGWDAGWDPKITLEDPSLQELSGLVQQLGQRRAYHDQTKHSPEVISGLMDSAWRDFYFLCALVIQNVDVMLFNQQTTLRIPTEFDEKNRGRFPGKVGKEGPGKIVYSRGTQASINRDIKKYIPTGYGVNWFPEDVPMFFQRDVAEPEGYHKKYLLSCLDKATFLVNCGTLFQSSLGYDKTQMTSANPFQVDAAGLQQEEQIDQIMKTFEKEMGVVNSMLDGWKRALQTYMVDATALIETFRLPLSLVMASRYERGVQGVDLFNPLLLQIQNAGADGTDLARIIQEAANIIDPKIKDVTKRINEELIDPFTKAVASLEEFQENAIARKKADMRIKKLEADLLKMKNQPGGGGGGGGGGSGPSSDADQKAQRLYLEAAVRLEVYKLLREGFKLFVFADLVAGGAVASLQRLLRNDYDDLVTKEILRNMPPDTTTTLPVIGGVGGYFELAILPFKDSFGTEMIFTPQLQFAVGKCFERVKLMIWMAAKGGRQGKSVIRIEDLTQGAAKELVVAFACSVSLELAATQEVQRKVSSTHHDQVLLLASVQNADSLLRGLLIKLGWACFASPYEETSVMRSNRLVFS